MKPGAAGSGVGDLQQSLVEAGEAIDAAELAGNRYGPGTEAAPQTPRPPCHL